MLILFDIDATLISTSGVGIRAMTDAGLELHGPGFRVDGIEFAGRLDPLIIADMFAASGIDPSPEALLAFRAAYERHLRKRLVDPSTVARALPGVHDLLAALARHETLTLGLLTGNFKETGSAKLRACGIEPDHFPLQVWGDESRSTPPCREDLPGVALERFHQQFNRRMPPRDALVIGDTPHDVRCAKAHACRCLGVATGSYSVEQLEAHGPDRVVPNLADTDGVVRWILRTP